MIAQILTIKDVEIFAKQLIKEGVSFHPGDDFSDYINLTTKEPSYTSEEIVARNELMSQCFNVCEKGGMDIYSICLETTLLETGLHKFIPLPSQS